MKIFIMLLICLLIVVLLGIDKICNASDVPIEQLCRLYRCHDCWYRSWEFSYKCYHPALKYEIDCVNIIKCPKKGI